MSWVTRLFGAKDSRTAVATQARVQQQVLPQPAWTPRDYEGFCREGYQQNIIIYRCIHLISTAAASVPWLVYDAKGNEMQTHELLSLLKRPNPVQSGKELFTALYAYDLLTGNGYLERVTSTISGGKPRELYALRPDRMRVLPGTSLVPRGYVYKVGNEEPTVWEWDVRTNRCDILHVKRFNPLNDWYGMSPLEAAAMSADSHSEATRWNKRVLQNGARPSGILTLPDEVVPDRYDEIAAKFEEKYQGAHNAGRPVVGPQGTEWVQMMLTAQDMDWLRGKEVSAREIALAYDVPEQLVGVPGQQTFNNYREARLAVYEDAVLPLLDRMAESLTNWFEPFYPGVRIGYDEDKIPALAPRREATWAKVAQADFLTVNEKREAVGYEPLKAGGDQLLVNSGQVPITFAEEEPLPPPEVDEEGDPPPEDETEDEKARRRVRLAYGG
nr:phage portal protein [uncultured Roseateles sp.]